MNQTMNPPTRISIAAIVSAIITLGLLFLMQLLIASGKPVATEDKIGSILDFVRVIRTTPPVPKDPTVKIMPLAQQPPRALPRPTMDDLDLIGGGAYIEPIPVNPEIGDIGTVGFVSDGDYLPIVKVAPIYPRRAQSRGIEGYVLIEFTVTRTGKVDTPVVIKAEPATIFVPAALAAVLKFKYKPRVVGGEAIDVPGVQNLFRFELDDGQ